MSAMPKHRFDFDEYLDIEERSPIKHEFYRGELFAMAGAKPAHNHVCGNFYHESRNALRGKSCLVFNSDQRVYVKNAKLATYPDVSFVCGKGEFIGQREDTLVNPIVIVEVMSVSTCEYDRGAKFELYKKLESLKEYVLIDPEAAEAVVYTRQADVLWIPTEYRGLEAKLVLHSLGIELGMKELFENVELGNGSNT